MYIIPNQSDSSEQNKHHTNYVTDNHSLQKDEALGIASLESNGQNTYRTMQGLNTSLTKQ